MTGATAVPGPPSRSGLTFDPRRWALWRQSRPIVAYVLVWEATVLAIATVAVLYEPVPSRLDWTRAMLLALCATVSIQLARRQDERRGSRKTVLFIDLTSIWTFPAVLVLPISLALSVLVLIRAIRWFSARRPPFRHIFSTASLAMAMITTHALMRLLGHRNWTELDGLGSLREFGIIIAAGLVYGIVQVAIIGCIFAIEESKPTLRTIVGTTDDNVLEAVTIALGAVTAILLVNVPAALAVMVVVSVAGSRIAEIRQLQVDVRTDPKTGLANMRGWQESATRALARASRDDTSVAILMVDLDHFKSINDTWGHPAGDDVLDQMARALESAIRPTDSVGRFGGEEFIVLLADTDALDAAVAAERIRAKIAELEVRTTDKRGGPVAIAGRTTSLGVAVFPDDGDTLDLLVQAADSAVYEAKEHGRNQVRLADGATRAMTRTQTEARTDR